MFAKNTERVLRGAQFFTEKLSWQIGPVNIVPVDVTGSKLSVIQFIIDRILEQF